MGRTVRLRVAIALLAIGLCGSITFALVPAKPGRLEHLVRRMARVRALGAEPGRLKADSPSQRGWTEFLGEKAAGSGWSGWFDTRSGMPLLVQGRGAAWSTNATAPKLDELERAARTFVETHPLLLGAWPGQLEFDKAASGAVGVAAQQVTFRQVVDGVPVEGARMDFHVVRGNLVAFGATSFAPVTRSTTPRLSVDEGRHALAAYLGEKDAPRMVDHAAPRLHLLPLESANGAGFRHALAWRFEFELPGEGPLWVAEVDADDGAILSFTDEAQYESMRGGVFPVSNDGACPSGCEQPNYPLPFADFLQSNGTTGYGDDHGTYACGATPYTTHTFLNGKYIKVVDVCGAVDQAVTCGAAFDLGVSTGTDCAVPAGASAGNTHSSRSSFYHLNRAMQKGRAWLPDNYWLQSQVVDNVNINAICNAKWNGQLNFYRSGGGCNNTGEIANVFVHEWGHGLDANDGGGYDNPSEAYADVVSFLEYHESCIGRGFKNSNCGGYGDACLACTGVRDQDWDKHASHAPATPTNFVQYDCGSGHGAPCGGEVHCEAHVAGETLWDLAVRDLPASGIDQSTAWQLAERLFYTSRNGSGGNIYNCSLPFSDGCSTTSWFHKLRVADDDDGDLSNGTPHAAAIFAAFNRHAIACGLATDPSNQSRSSCTPLPKPIVTLEPGDGSVKVTFPMVPGAASYRILRNDLGCDRAQVIVGNVAAPGTAYLDDLLTNGMTLNYRVQAIGANPVCDSPISDCVSASPGSGAGSVELAKDLFPCSGAVSVTVKDGNAVGPTVTVHIFSDFDPDGEDLVLYRQNGTSTFANAIYANTGPSYSDDGLLSLHEGDRIDVQYVDENDGQGHANVMRTDYATADCAAPAITNVRGVGVTTTTASVLWDTNEPADSVLTWGTSSPSTTTAQTALTTTHWIDLSGLQPCTVYRYQVRSTDAAGNVADSNNAWRYYRFETLGDYGAGVQACHMGRLTLDKDVLACSDTVTVQVVDRDLNLRSNAVDTVTVDVASTTEPTPETLVLTETGVNTARFTAVAHVGQGAPVHGDGIVQVAHGDTITATYHDANDGTNSPRIEFDTALEDCAGPDITNVRVTDITDESATIRFTTSEAATGTIEWGTTSALGQSTTEPSAVIEHAITLAPLTECGRAYFRIRANDPRGNQRVYDGAGQPIGIAVFRIPGTYRESFERVPPWTLEGEWQMAAPQGLGTSPGDPTSAFTGSRVLGLDLTGLGAHPGDYEPNASTRAISPAIDVTEYSHLQLKFRRWLSVGNGATASVEISGDGGTTWTTAWSSTYTEDARWTLATVDISSIADHYWSMRIAFKLNNPNLLAQTHAGWNIDRLIVHPGTAPDYEGCGGCGMPPAFAGAKSVTDHYACAGGGVLVTWDPASAWGTASDGTYTIWRDVVPNFTPTAANRIATSVVGTSYVDKTAPYAKTLYYLVRAENFETCSTGAANGGLTDSNTVYRSVTTGASGTIPAAVDTLRAALVDAAHVRLTWSSAAGGSTYRVLRSVSASAAFGTLRDTTTTNADDIGAGWTAETYFYVVHAVNGCGVEGP